MDRSFDLVTPLLHEFTYQAMVYDLIDLDGNKFSYGSSLPFDDALVAHNDLT